MLAAAVEDSSNKHCIKYWRETKCPERPAVQIVCLGVNMRFLIMLLLTHRDHI